MCPPVALAIASAAVAATGAVFSGISQAQQYRYQAQVADQNAKLAADQARDSIETTNTEALRARRAQAQTEGQQTAAMAANGVDLSFGSAADVVSDTKMLGNEDVAQIYKGGNERTRGYDINAWNYRSQAAGARAKAKGAMVQGILGGLSSALGAASQVTGMKGGGGGSVGGGNTSGAGSGDAYGRGGGIGRGGM
jgi:hypothetical protein